MTGSQSMTVPRFRGLKGKTKIAMVTAYDFPTARLVDQAGVDAILVGDSLAMVVQGHTTTLPVALEEMIYHAEMVARAVSHALIVVDLPFPTYFANPQAAIDAAARVLKRTHCHAVKLEGGSEQAPTIEALTRAGIPVMGHVGLRPQSVHQMGGYRVQRDVERLREDALTAQQAGAFSVVLECVPASAAEQLSRLLEIPTVGIGAGAGCDGQVLVLHDLLGLTGETAPRFVKAYADLAGTIRQAVQTYCEEVRTGTFPDADRSYR